MKVSPRQRRGQGNAQDHQQIDPPSAARAHPSARGDPRPAKATVGTRSISFLAAGHHTPSLIEIEPRIALRYFRTSTTIATNCAVASRRSITVAGIDGEWL